MQQQNTQTFQLENEQKKIGFFFTFHCIGHRVAKEHMIFNVINYSGNANSNHNEISLCTSQWQN